MIFGSKARLWFIGAAVLAAAAFAVPPTFGQTAGVYRVEVGTIQEIELSQTLQLTGSLDPWRDIEIGSRARGRIILIPIEEGRQVKKGDVLFEMDDRADQIALARAKAELDKALAERKKMKSGSLPQEIVSARKAAEAAQARLKAAQDEWDRLRPLAEEKVISEREATRGRSALEVAQSEYSQAEAKLKLVEEGFRSEEVMIAEAEVKARQAAVDDILRRIDDHHVTAPETGAIVARLKEPGEWANEGETVARMVVLDPMKLRIEVPQAQIASVHSGQKAAMSVDGIAERTFAAEVTNVIPQARSETRNFPVLLKVENSDLALSAGMFARVRLAIGDKYKGLSVPREAVQYRGTKLVIYRVEDLPPELASKNAPAGDAKPGSAAAPTPDAIAREVEVKISEELKDRVIIKPVGAGKLAPGDEIVVSGGSRLKEGSLLKRLNPPMPGAG
ncbi:efflux RND transporter periplasmic adaptor subunit [Candidatus Sumerlaeota bacterium]|nr:efflux RND transporter periplasmic adaptor subunit [Candidatus Sumerlaeota bacterium]